MPSCGELRRLRPLLGTFVEIRVQAASEQAALAAIERGFHAVEQVHALMSFHERGSDLARLNRWGHAGAVEVHGWTYRAIAAALGFSLASGGTFDCTVAPVLVRHGLLPGVLDGDRPTGDWRDVELLRGKRVRFGRPLGLDLGGIAKGFAVDRAIEAIQGGTCRAGLRAAAVNAGGDLRLFGPEEELVQARDPDAPDRLAPLGWLRDGAVATSGRLPGGPDLTPFVDPARGRLVRARSSVSVIAADATTADALTKPVLLRGRAASAALLAKYGAEAIVLGTAKDVAGQRDAA